MNKIVKYNLEIMSGIFTVIIAVSLLHWSELSVVRQMTVVFMILYTLHEWEESRFPGGFYRIFFSKCTIDPNVSEEKLRADTLVFIGL